MRIKEKHKIVVFLFSVLILIISLFSYWTLKKEQIKIIVNDKVIITSSFKKNIKDLLDEKGIKYDNNDKITPNLNDELKDYMEINIVNVDIKIYEDGKLVDKNLVSEKVVNSPTNKVIKKGIKEEIMVASRGNNSRQMSVVATAYATGTITATGTKPKWGTIAVDQKVIPYGTKVYIPKFNMTFTAEDCGGDIKGNKIDIFMGSETDAYSWGRRTIDIYILN